MRAMQFWFQDQVRIGGFCADVFDCEVLLIKSDTIFNDVNLRMKIAIRGKTTEYKEDFSFLAEVVNCDAESIFQSIQQVIAQRSRVLEKLLQKNPGGKFIGLRVIIKFLSGIEREQVSVSKSVFIG